MGTIMRILSGKSPTADVRDEAATTLEAQTGPSDDLRPRVYDDIQSWILFERSEGPQYVVGSLTADRYVAVPENRLDTTMALIHLFDGRHSLSEIRSYAREQLGQDANVKQLYELLSEAGLVVDPPPAHIAQGEFKELSIKLLEFGIDGLGRLKPIINVVFVPIVWISAILIVAGLASAPGDLLFAERSFQISSSYILGFLALNLAMMTASLLHEFAHCLVSIKLGLLPRKFAAVLYLGFSLFFYVEIPGIYTLKPKDRIKIWLSGSWMNLTIAGVVFLLLRLVSFSKLVDQFLLKIAIANLMMIIGNLSPLMPTDGYFVVSTLLKTWNLRTNAWQLLKSLVKGRMHTRHGWLVWVYLALAGGVIARAMVFQIQWIFGILKESTRNFSLIGRFLIILAFVLLGLLSRFFTVFVKQVFKKRSANQSVD